MKYTPKHTKICQICGAEFVPRSRGQRTCDNVHTRPCPVCGKPVPFKYMSDRIKCCSTACTQQLKKQTWIEKYGVNNPAKSDEVMAKQAATNLKRYGATTPFTMDGFKEKSKQTNLSRYGAEYPMQSDSIKEKHRKSCEAHWGVGHPFNMNHVRDKLYAICSDPDKLKLAASKRSVTLVNTASDGTKLDSKYELAVYEFCLRNNLEVERQIPIQYKYNGTEHTTFIDFKINGILFECKGGHLLHGCYDGAPNLVPIDVKLAVYRKHHVVIITDRYGGSVIGNPESDTSNGLKYLDKCSDPLIGVDIDLFSNRTFPYKVDRPKCFYDVRVDGKLSPREAFMDDRIIFKMIMNRIQYTGGFIDNRAILKAMNVTRTCKQPSWFSKSYAIKLISKYVTSDTIVDPFAGWGTRHDAAVACHRMYLGCDMNPALVKWHQEKGRDIICADAYQFTYDKECSVLICPPYFDPSTGRCLEDYRFDGFDRYANQLSQCEWLDIVMKNIPNAREYIMVCKVVDTGWEQYIVETKRNKSHLGVNMEYVLCVHNDSR